MCLILYRFTQFPLESAEIDSFAILDLDNTPEREALCLACSSADKRLLCLKIMLGDACATGEKLTWSRDMGSRAWNLATSEVPVPGSPGRVLVHAGREDGNFHAYDADGVPAWSHKFMATISEFCSYNDPVTRQSLVLVPSLDKTLRLLDASNGHLVWGDTFQSGVNVASFGQSGGDFGVGHAPSWDKLYDASGAISRTSPLTRTLTFAFLSCALSATTRKLVTWPSFQAQSTR